MTFYVDPAFFAFAILLGVPAFICGYNEKRMQSYGLMASIVMLAFLFSRSLDELAAFGVFLIVSSACTAAVLHWFRIDAPHKLARYRIALFVALIPLICTKVSAVFDENLLGFIGISYLTFKSIQVLIEIRDGLISELTPGSYLYFLLFFPVFTSGPIMRSRDFMAQLAQAPKRQDYLELVSKGIFVFIIGCLYSFALAPVCEWAEWFLPEAIGTATALATIGGQLLQALFYGLYLFFNFAGYSFLATGIGSLFGIQVPRNFKAPFASIDIKDFWNRWHITLSFWLRDFVFMRLTRTFMKHKVFTSRITTACISYICNMTIMGIWHGITVDYILYGLFHGLLLAACELVQKKSKFYKIHRKKSWFKALSWAVTMICVFFGFALFSGQVTIGVLGVLHG